MNNPFNLPNNGMFNPNNPVILGGMAGLNIGAGIVPIIDYVEGNLKTDTKKMSRGNIRQVDKTIKAINVSQQDNAEEIFRALRKARSLREDITIRLRRGELTEEGLDNLNNKSLSDPERYKALKNIAFHFSSAYSSSRNPELRKYVNSLNDFAKKNFTKNSTPTLLISLILVDQIAAPIGKI